ncbi:MAG: hypothetical protein B7Z08_03020 [Sphingomonadales bacterium 32-68-7]|nr:MAG: hypothetical protein B7Z33_12960 [Sphingomonadales bacterium 12-68-11]OYX10018.1 MAG: hypothetical protein B7Z08_03020 [Sphingomonadales bacterium 32-68-7]
MFTQLANPIPVHVLDKGDGYAIAVIDYGQEHDLLWVTALDASGEIWCAPNPRVRMQPNWTMGRRARPAADRTPEPAAAADFADQAGEPCTDCSAVLV